MGEQWRGRWASPAPPDLARLRGYPPEQLNIGPSQLEEAARRWAREKQELGTRLLEKDHGFGGSAPRLLHATTLVSILQGWEYPAVGLAAVGGRHFGGVASNSPEDMGKENPRVGLETSEKCSYLPAETAPRPHLTPQETPDPGPVALGGIPGAGCQRHPETPRNSCSQRGSAAFGAEITEQIRGEAKWEGGSHLPHGVSRAGAKAECAELMEVSPSWDQLGTPHVTPGAGGAGVSGRWVCQGQG